MADADKITVALSSAAAFLTLQYCPSLNECMRYAEIG